MKSLGKCTFSSSEPVQTGSSLSPGVSLLLPGTMVEGMFTNSLGEESHVIFLKARNVAFLDKRDLNC